MTGKDDKPVFGAKPGFFSGFLGGNTSSKDTQNDTESPTQPQITILPMSQTTMRLFKPAEDNWVIYKEQLQNYFISLGCEDDHAKRTLFLNCLDTGAYQIGRDMCSHRRRKRTMKFVQCRMVGTCTACGDKLWIRRQIELLYSRNENEIVSTEG